MQRDIEGRLSEHAEICDVGERREPRSITSDTKLTTSPAMHVEMLLGGPHYGEFQNAILRRRRFELVPGIC
jgi:hypothetical protein